MNGIHKKLVSSIETRTKTPESRPKATSTITPIPRRPTMAQEILIRAPKIGKLKKSSRGAFQPVPKTERKANGKRLPMEEETPILPPPAPKKERAGRLEPLAQDQDLETSNYR